MPRPVILLVFANDRRDGAGYLRELDPERRLIRRALDPALDDGRCRLEAVVNATLGDVIGRVEDHRDAIVGVHFAGHADPEGLKLEDDDGRLVTAFAHGLVDLFAGLPRLRWIVLNGCSTGEQARALSGDRAIAVIATDCAIRDDLARTFAGRFYETLRAGGTLGDAYETARVSCAVGLAEPAQAFRMLRPASPPPTEWPWRLHIPEAHPGSDGWVLPSRAGGVRVAVMAAAVVLLLCAAAVVAWALRSPAGSEGAPDRAAVAVRVADAAPVYAAPLDAIPPDAAPVDAALFDAAPPDAAPPDAIAQPPPRIAPRTARTTRRPDARTAEARAAFESALTACRCADAGRHLSALPAPSGALRARHERGCAPAPRPGSCARALSDRLTEALATCRCDAARDMQSRLKSGYGIDRAAQWRERCWLPGLPGSCL